MALHVFCFEKKFEDAWAALFGDADVNEKANLHGYIEATPLIIAAGEGSLDIFMALLIFDADVHAVDGCGHSALHHAGKLAISGKFTVEAEHIIYYLKMFGAVRCRIKEGCSEYCSHNGQKNGMEFPGVSGQRINKIYDEFLKRGAILPDEEIEKVLFSFEGGGIRGAGSILQLWYIERVLATMHESQPEEGIKIINYVDYLIGTSTGAIIALGLASGKTVKEMFCLYMQLKDQIFSGFKPYSSENLGTFLKNELGDLTMQELENRSGKKVIICVSKGDETCPEPVLFRTYIPALDASTEEEQNLTEPSVNRIWEVGKWSAAAPGYFKLDHPMFYDGGLTINNPTLAGIDEMFYQRINDMDYHNRSCNAVVSFGTGILPVENMETSDMDISLTSLEEIMKAPFKALKALDILVNLATKTNGKQVEYARNRCSEMGADFYRFSAPLEATVKLDETNNLVLCYMLFRFIVYMRENHRFVVNLCEKLIKLRSN